METDHRSLLAMLLAVASVLDLLLIPVLRARIQGQPMIMLSLLASSALMMGLAAAFWFGWLPPG
jgi:MFS-type transporter involved in bile tolerance (Atg22 family)